MRSVTELAPPWLTFIRASEWGAFWKRPPVAELQNDPETYIHHGAGGRWGNDHGAAMRSLMRWYHDTKNYSMIAYDVMVHRNLEDETVAICGAREGYLSGATYGRNEEGEAICLFGYFHPGHRLSEHPTAREIEALAFAVAWSIEMGWSALDTNVLGHRDNPKQTNGTTCPGDYLYPHIPSITTRAFNLLAIAAEDNPMQTLPIPQRIYDSRNEPEGALDPGETRSVHIFGSPAEVFINLTVIGLDGSTGYLSANDPDGLTSSIGYSGDDRIESNGIPVVSPGGVFTVTNTGGRAHFAVDVMQHR